MIYRDCAAVNVISLHIELLVVEVNIRVTFEQKGCGQKLAIKRGPL